jgi:hypothetical protein
MNIKVVDVCKIGRNAFGKYMSFKMEYTCPLFISVLSMKMLYLKLKRSLCLGMIKLEVRRMLGEENLKEYIKDMWKVMDLGTTCLYVFVIILRLLAYFKVSS